MGLNFQELVALAVVLVVGMIVLRFIVWNPNIVKINFNAHVYGLDFPVNRPSNAIDAVRLYIEGRSAQKIVSNWDCLLFDLIARREQSAFTVQLAGRKVTFVVDTRDQEKKRGERGRIHLTLIQNESDPDFRCRLDDVQIEGSLASSALPQPEQVRSEHAEDGNYD